MEKSKVYFTKTITEDKIVEMYKVLNQQLKGNIAIKVHSGEKGNQNYLKPEFFCAFLCLKMNQKTTSDIRKVFKK